MLQKSIIIFASLMFIFSFVNVGFCIDGNELYDMYNSYDRHVNKNTEDVNYLQVGYFLGYVQAMGAAYNNFQITHDWDIDTNVPWGKLSTGQMCDVFGKFLKYNPDIRHKEGAILFAECIMQNFSELEK